MGFNSTDSRYGIAGERPALIALAEAFSIAGVVQTMPVGREAKAAIPAKTNRCPPQNGWLLQLLTRRVL